MISMNYKALVTLFVLIALAISVNAYSGFNREYYTANYGSTYYQPSPYYSNAGYAYNGYVNSTPSAVTYGYYGYSPYTYATYYPSVTYTSVGYYPGRYTTVIQPSYYNYGRTINVWKNDSGWGFSLGSSGICSIYGYC